MGKLKDPDGEHMVVYHGTKIGVDALDTSRTVDGGLHFGTYEQASMRSAQRVIHAHIEVSKVRRSRDRGGDWKKRIGQAKSAGFDAIVYLNRYEGIPLHRVEHAQDNNIDLDRLSDREFSKLIPEARDSWIVFDVGQINILGVEDKPRTNKGLRA